jgi:hypothetical protein
MGMDAVEILMEVEEVFEIEIDDASAEKMKTPRELISSIMDRVAQADETACLSQRAFHLLRKALLRHLSIKRRELVATALMSTLVPKPDRGSLMESLAAELGTGPLPDLERPRWLVVLLVTLSVAIGFGSVAALHQHKPLEEWGVLFFVGGAVAAVTGFFVSAATSRLCTEFPPITLTVGDLTRWILAHKTDLASPRQGRWTREQVAARVREIVIGTLNCASTYREDASFIDDLGLS